MAQQLECEKDLAAAEPAVIAAEEALKTLNKKDVRPEQQQACSILVIVVKL